MFDPVGSRVTPKFPVAKRWFPDHIGSMAFIINGEKISDEVVEDEFESIKEHYVNAGEVVCCDRDEEFWAFAKENVVNRVLLEQASLKKYGEVSDAEVDAKFNQIVSEHGSEDAFYENTGFNRGDELMLRRKVKSGIMVDRYLEDEMGSPGPPTEADLKQFYQDNIDQYMSGIQVEVNQLFVEPSSHEEAKQVFDDLFELRKRMLKGESFVELTAEFCNADPDEVRMGYISQGQNMPEIESTVFSMMDGEISPVVPTRFGFHMFEVTGRKEPEPIPIDEISDLEQTFLDRRRQDGIDSIIERLTNEGSVEETEPQDE